MELKERNCHRLKAVLREVSVKCIRESIWRTRAASSQVRDYTRYVYQGGGCFCARMSSIRVEPRIYSVSCIRDGVFFMQWGTKFPMIRRRGFYGHDILHQGRDSGDPGTGSGHYRVAHKLYLKKHYFLARWVSQRAVRKTGIEIHPGATIGRGLFIDHGSGVIIGETAEIGDNVTLYQGVTLGGTGKEQGKRHPTLKDNVMVSAGAKVLGSFTIWENSKIGAGSVVLKEVPPNCTVVGVPGRIVKMGDQKIPRLDMDQIHLPDPISNDIRELQADNIRLHTRLQEMERRMKCMKEENIEVLDKEEESRYEAV